ncbi:prepilin-type N-terminal cleavage/methylation domain-containing protein [bacterium]|jgi:prepilin-type N-terminal cleavage/methylation domain-containing protein|nr:prepilin-type N-terminal cleavage/methylation domain-containing protein [bacterium]
MLRKNNFPKGFSLLEVLLSVVVLGLAIKMLASIQVTHTFRAIDLHDELTHLMEIKTRLQKALLLPPKNEKVEKDQLEHLDMSLETSAYPIDSKKSSLKDFVEQLRFLKVTGTWKLRGQKRNSSMTAIIPTPPPDPKETS